MCHASTQLSVALCDALFKKLAPDQTVSPIVIWSQQIPFGLGVHSPMPGLLIVYLEE